MVPREIQDNGYAKFFGGWGWVNKVHYNGLCENGEQPCQGWIQKIPREGGASGDLPAIILDFYLLTGLTNLLLVKEL